MSNLYGPFGLEPHEWRSSEQHLGLALQDLFLLLVPPCPFEEEAVDVDAERGRLRVR